MSTYHHYERNNKSFAQLFAPHAAGMAKLHALCFDESARWNTKSFEELLIQNHVRAISVVNGSTVAGFIMISIALDEAEILTLAIHPEQRRKGYAKALINDCFEEYLGAQTTPPRITKMFLDVIETNIPAITLYQSLGFSIISKRPHYYSVSEGNEKKLVDGLVMSKTISSQSSSPSAFSSSITHS